MLGGTATHSTEPAPATSPASNSPSQHDQELTTRVAVQDADESVGQLA